MRMSEVHALAQGRVYTGDGALEAGLVDRLGGFASALERARQRAGLPRDTGFEIRPSRPATLIDYVLSGTGLARAQLADGLDAAAEAELDPQPSLGRDARGAMDELGRALGALSPEGRRLLRVVYLMRAVQSGEPMALLPFSVETR
jgi:ClpP class serine protease